MKNKNHLSGAIFRIFKFHRQAKFLQKYYGIKRIRDSFRGVIKYLKGHLHGAMHRAIDRLIDGPMHLICSHTYTIDRAICSVPLCLFRLLPQAELTGNRAMTD